jgi:hypothetical protein
MSIDVRELLQGAVPPPPPGPGLPELVRRGQRRRQRRRLLVGASVLTLMAGSAAGAVALATRQSTSRIEIRPAAGSNSAAGVSVTLPPGWMDLPRASNGDPLEILVVGTAARPRQDPITGCPTGETPPPHGAIYLSLYEYPSIDGPLLPPDKLGTTFLPLPLDQFGSRGPDGSVQGGIASGGNNCGRPVPGVPRPGDFIDIPFQDGNRFFVARIATVGTDSSDQGFLSGEAVLKTLRVVPKPGTSGTSAGTPTSLQPR